jgi:hypothetical protein
MNAYVLQEMADKRLFYGRGNGNSKGAIVGTCYKISAPSLEGNLLKCDAASKISKTKWGL